MRKNLLGILGSPRKSGNCELFVREIRRHLQGDWQLRLARLPAMDIKPCRACYQCLFGDGKCPQQDDFAMLLAALVEADAYVVAAPTYLLSANASLKQFLDRGLSFYAHADRLWLKPAVGVAIAGIEGMEGFTKLSVESFIKLTMGELRGVEVVYGALPGEVFLQSDGRAAAARLAKLLEGEALERKPGLTECTVCGGDTFRFLPDGTVRCMLCSSAGNCGMHEGRPAIHTQAGGHELFLTLDGVKRHADWLRRMKDEFLKKREQLKAVVRQYDEPIEWLRPAGPRP